MDIVLYPVEKYVLGSEVSASGTLGRRYRKQIYVFAKMPSIVNSKNKTQSEAEFLVSETTVKGAHKH